MLREMRSALQKDFVIWVTALVVFLAVFFLVVVTSTLVTFIMPESYAGTVRLRLEPPQAAGAHPQGSQGRGAYDPYLLRTEMVVIQSEVVLGRASDRLNLRESWGKRYANGERLTSIEAINGLKNRMSVRPVKGATVLEIQVFDEAPTEASALANAVAEAYRDCSLSGSPAAPTPAACGAGPARPRVEIIDRATPPLRPARPNKPLNLCLGVLAGTFLGSIAAAAAATFVFLIRRRARGGAAPP